jgi:predicted transcriptional regulator
MPRQKAKTPTKVELEFMQIVWEKGEVTTEDIQGELLKKGRKLADGAIRRMLAILIEKGYLSRRKEGMAFYYRAKVDEEEAARTIAEDLLERAFRGKASLLVAALLDGRSIRKNDLDEIKKLIREKEKGG